MRLLLACPYAWDAPGGVQIHVRELAARMRERGHDVVVLAPSSSAPSESWVRAVGRPLPLRYNRSSAPICPWPASYRRVALELRRFGPDIVHAHEPMTPSTSMFATLSGAAPVVATFHSGASRALLFDVAAPVLRRVARRISVRIAVSRAAEAFASRRLGDGFRIVPNGAEIERFEHAEPAELSPGRRIVFVGRLDPRKGFPIAVEALRQLAGEYPDVRLVAAGDGPERSAVRELPPEIRARVDLLGTVRNTDLPPVLAAAEVFVAPSLGGESFGMVLIEAMAAGVPVVASRIPGYDEVVRDGVDGLLVPPGDPDALAANVRRLLEDRGLAGRLADSGRARARGFSWDVVLDQIEAAYGDARSA